MSPGKKRQSASSAKKSPAKTARSGAQQTTRVEGSSAQKASAKTAAKKTSTKKASSKSTVSKPAKKAAKTPASDGASTKKSPQPKTSARKSPTKKAAMSKAAAPKKSPAARTPRKKATTSRPPVSRAARPVLSEKRLATVHKQLEKTRSELQRQIAEIDLETFRGTQSDLSGEVALSEDFADAGTATFERERDLSLQNNSRDLVAQIDKALMRIGDGSYGSCERCGRSITAARLRTLPHVSLCQDCKRREERVR